MTKLRAPAVPLITVDPFFTVWSQKTSLNFQNTIHWSKRTQYIFGAVFVDGTEYVFLGYEKNERKLLQTSLEINALSTLAVYEGAGIRLHARFMTPLLLDDLKIMTRPVSYLELSYESTDGKHHEVTASVSVSFEHCMPSKDSHPLLNESFVIGDITGVKLGAVPEEQNPLSYSGDNVVIDWGYLYLGAVGDDVKTHGDILHPYRLRPGASVEAVLDGGKSRLFLFAYDDIESINYFGDRLRSVWCHNGTTIEQAMINASEDYESLKARCDKFSSKLTAEATKAGGEKYAELLSLAYRQVIAAHKLVVDKDGELVLISKECDSNGCAATVDVSYPTMPIFLRYCPDLVRALMRPIYKFAASEKWTYDFAPHDAGHYPIVTGQYYGYHKATDSYKYESQMPVEECGNMIIMEACALIADGKTDFVSSHLNTLKGWVEYLIKYGEDPENQLCTDDFAGHMAHNCNLSLKAIMGIMGMSIISKKLGDKIEAQRYERIAREMAESWCKRASNGDGSFRLAFDKPGTFSMKYNMIWDKLWGTNLFPKELIKSEVESYFPHFLKYGLPLDSRAEYTKSDWLVWTATLAEDKETFERFIEPLWDAYNETSSRYPMSDWYDAASANHIAFIHRPVQGGLFIKLLDK